MAQRIRQVMTADPVTVTPDTPVAAVARLMREKDIGNVLVAEGDTLRGLVTDRDLVVRVLAADGAAARTAAEACSSELVSVTPDDETAKAGELMRRHALRRLPVVDNGRPVGIVSLGDLAVDRDPESALGHVSASDPNR
jgi:CBS domain-containing protein